MTDSNQTQWVESVGQSLINNVTVSLGGDPRPYWYCLKCGTRSELKPATGATCGRHCSEFNPDKFNQYYKKVFPFLNDPIIWEKINLAIQNNPTGERLVEFRKYLTTPTETSEFKALIQTITKTPSLQLKIIEQIRKLDLKWLNKLDDYENAFLEEEAETMVRLPFDLDDVLIELLGDEVDFRDHWVCNGTNYVERQDSGQVIDNFSSQWLNLWDSFS